MEFRNWLIATSKERLAEVAAITENNKWRTKCAKCGQMVEPNTGRFEGKDERGRWIVVHQQCPAEVMPQPERRQAVNQPGGDVELGAPGTPCNICGADTVLKKSEFGPWYGCTMYNQTGCKGKGGPLPTGAQAQQTQQARPDGRTWFLATAIDVSGINPGAPVALAQNRNGGFDYVDPNEASGELPISGIQNHVQRVTRDGDIVKGPNPQSLFQMFTSGQCDQKPTDTPQSEVDPEGGELDGSAGPIEGLGDMSMDELLRLPEVDDLRKQAKTIQRPQPEEVRIPPENMTEYNQAIENRFTQTQDPVMINALAGTGKTTMLKHLSSFIKPGEKWLYLVFNKKNQVEAQKDFPAGVTTLTSHSYLQRVLKQNGKEFGGNSNLPERDPETGHSWQKIYKAADKHVDPIDWPETGEIYFSRKWGREINPFNWNAKSKACSVASKAKAYGIFPDSPTIMEDLVEVCKVYNWDNFNETGKFNCSTDYNEEDRDFTQDILKMAMELLQITSPNAKFDPELDNYRDHDDTLWFAAMNADAINWNAGDLKYNVVLMDEVQDFNQCQLIMATKLKEAGARVVAVGDPNQAMYAFRGADSQAFNRLSEAITGGTDSMDLPLNFRSGTVILDKVEELTGVPVKAPEWQKETGEFHDDVTQDDFTDQLISESEAGNGMLAQQTSMICRANAPLTEAALNFMKSGIDFEIVGKDLYKQLKSLVFKVVGKKNIRTFEIQDLAASIESWVEDFEREHGNHLHKKEELDTWKETRDALIPVLDHLREEGDQAAVSSDSNADPGRAPALHAGQSYVHDGKQLQTSSDFLGYLEDKLGGVDLDAPMEVTTRQLPDGNILVIVLAGIAEAGKNDRRTEYVGVMSESGLQLRSSKKDRRGQNRNAPKEIYRFAERELKDPRSYVNLITAHKSKGFEYERVFVMQPSLFDPKENSTEDQAQQEKNAFYVALTRAMKNLTIELEQKKMIA